MKSGLISPLIKNINVVMVIDRIAEITRNSTVELPSIKVSAILKTDAIVKIPAET
jgi:hypothetical protein